MTSTGNCHVCGVSCGTFFYRRSLEETGIHDGYWHCSDHGPDPIKVQRERLEEKIDEMINMGEIKEGDFKIEENADGSLTLVDYRGGKEPASNRATRRWMDRNRRGKR